MIIKAIKSSSNELSILQYLNHPNLRSDPRNRTIPVLDIITIQEWALVVMPCWELHIGSHPAYFVRDYILTAKQCVEVCFSSQSDVISLMYPRAWHLCMSTD